MKIKKEYLFTPGPVPMSKEVLNIGSQQISYFRNEEFSNIVFESKKLLLKLVNAPKDSEVIFLTSSGTGAMEATIINLLNHKNKAAIINGGGFGQRFVDICDRNKIPNYNIQLSKNKKIKFDTLQKLDIDTFIINAHETTIGRLYDLKKVGNFCRKNKLLNIVDAISTFVCDTIDMKTQSIDALILSSNKGLALPPGLGMVILTPNAIKRLKKHTSVYFDFKNYIQNMKRGQTPFTPTISIINQLHFRLKQLDKYGIKKEVKKKKKLANYFRKKITKLPLKFYVDTMPNGMTTLTPTDGQLAYKIIEDFKQQYNIVLTPSGGALANKLIRVSHMGEMNKKYLDILINSLYRYYKIDR